ncbi:MAG: leucyl/phenylalanyl-tRNA--protein transferase [Sinobacteraceae bacterium]|nr:leucyl/phenylalanyl-tRNA--protein transferase [Nevskiaceae bacterium]
MHNPVRLHWLDPRNPEQPFPPPQQAMWEPNGLLAIGGDLSPERLLRAYAAGIFPWFNQDEPILWWSPDPRAVMKPTDIHVSHTLAKRLRQGRFGVSADRAFAAVLEGCAGARAHSHGTWLGPEMRHAYQTLHERGHAHSIEVWVHGELAGGLYGVALGQVFFGESMFSHATDASKIALVSLARQLEAWQFSLIDCQLPTAHLESLGACTIPRQRFLAQLATAVKTEAHSGRWTLNAGALGQQAHLPW